MRYTGLNRRVTQRARAVSAGALPILLTLNKPFDPVTLSEDVAGALGWID